MSHIDTVCKEYDIENYTINSDGSIDVDGSVGFLYKGLDELPLKFGKVSGNFSCGENKLTSLQGCPSSVGGYFSCGYNKLTSLEGCPTSVGGDFECAYNKLTSLEGCPSSVGGAFVCYYNKLSSLEFCPTSVGGDFDCYDNKLTSLEFSPTSIGGDFSCSFNKLPRHFIILYNNFISEERKIFFKYHHDLRIWDNEYNEEATQDLYEDIKDGML